MSRSGYRDDWCDWDGAQWAHIRYRGAVSSAFRGARGQAFFRELVAALDAMPEKKLIAHDLQNADGCVCAIGAVGAARGVEMAGLDPEAAEDVSAAFGIATAMAREVVYANDECGRWDETPEQRWLRMRRWAEEQIRVVPG